MLMDEREMDHILPGKTTAGQCERRDLTQELFGGSDRGGEEESEGVWRRLDS